MPVSNIDAEALAAKDEASCHPCLELDYQQSDRDRSLEDLRLQEIPHNACDGAAVRNDIPPFKHPYSM